MSVGSSDYMICRGAPSAWGQASVLSNDDVVGSQNVVAGAAGSGHVCISDCVFDLRSGYGVSRAANARRIDHRGGLIKANKTGIEAVDGVIRGARRIGRSSAHKDIERS